MRRALLLGSASLATLSVAAIAATQQEVRTHTYDALGRLVSTEVAGGTNQNDTRTFCFDENGNRTNFMTRENGTVPACSAPTPTPSPTLSPSPTPTPTPTPPPTNNPPNAVNDTVSGVCYSTVFIDLTSNDSDPDGDTPLSVTEVNLVSGNASATLFPTGLVEVMFGPQFDLSTFNYTLEDPSGASDTATLTVATSSCSGIPEI